MKNIINDIVDLLGPQNPARSARELRRALGQTVLEVMSCAKAAPQPEQSLHEAAWLLASERGHRWPVMNDSQALVGMLSHSATIRLMAWV